MHIETGAGILKGYFLFRSIVVCKPAFGRIRRRKMTEGIQENEDAGATYSRRHGLMSVRIGVISLSHPSENLKEVV